VSCLAAVGVEATNCGHHATILPDTAAQRPVDGSLVLLAEAAEGGIRS
jgi:hypothetical protein